jgi:hypothetical protein
MKFVAMVRSSHSEARSRPLWDDSPGRFVEQLDSREIIHIAAGADACARAAGKRKQSMYNRENLNKPNKMDRLAPELRKAFWAFDKETVKPRA